MMKLISALTTRHMLTAALVVASAHVLLGQVPSAKTGAAKCTDIPISYTFLATTVAQATMWNDVATPYQNSVDGVTNTVIHRCEGTYDATMVLDKSQRFVWMQFPTPIQGSLIMAGPPSFAGGPAFQTQAFFNVRNVLNSGSIMSTSAAADFYTRMVSQLPAPDGNSYGLYFHPDDGACPGDLPCVLDLDAPSLSKMNAPVEASWVKVHFMPPPNPAQPWSLSNTAKWLVDGEQADAPSGLYERGSLFLHPTNAHGTDTHEGQYAMPFQILITALGPI